MFIESHRTGLESSELEAHDDAADVVSRAPCECLIRQPLGCFLNVDDVSDQGHGILSSSEDDTQTFSVVGECAWGRLRILHRNVNDGCLKREKHPSLACTSREPCQVLEVVCRDDARDRTMETSGKPWAWLSRLVVQETVVYTYDSQHPSANKNCQTSNPKQKPTPKQTDR